MCVPRGGGPRIAGEGRGNREQKRTVPPLPRTQEPERPTLVGVEMHVSGRPRNDSIKLMTLFPPPRPSLLMCWLPSTPCPIVPSQLN
jgi:hypothetical protein